MKLESGIVKMQIENEKEIKTVYALKLLEVSDPFVAALALFPDNTEKALFIASQWAGLPEIKEIQSGILSKDEFAGVPTRSGLAKDIWDKMQGSNVGGMLIKPTIDEYVKLAKLYAEVRGYIEKPSTTINNNNVIAPRVIEVPIAENLDEWEIAASKQQSELLDVSRSKH